MRADGCENAGLAGNDAKKQINRNSVFFILFLSVVLLIYKNRYNPSGSITNPIRFCIYFAFIAGGVARRWNRTDMGGCRFGRSLAAEKPGFCSKGNNPEKEIFFAVFALWFCCKEIKKEKI